MWNLIKHNKWETGNNKHCGRAYVDSYYESSNSKDMLHINIIIDRVYDFQSSSVAEFLTKNGWEKIYSIPFVRLQEENIKEIEFELCEISEKLLSHNNLKE